MICEDTNHGLKEPRHGEFRSFGRNVAICKSQRQISLFSAMML